MATIDWEERVFQLASNIYASNIDEMDAESAIANALAFKEKYIEIMELDTPKPEKKSKEKAKDDSFEDAWLQYRRKGSKKKAAEQWAKLSDEERATAMKHIVVYVGNRDLQYQKDFERYLRDKCFNDVLYGKNTILFDPSQSDDKPESKKEEKLVIGGVEYK